MPWGRVDDKLHGNEKFAEAGLEATGLWLLCLTWCCDNLTDGKLSRVIIERYGGTKAKKLTKALLDVKLWEERDGEIWVHNYLKYNPSRADVESDRVAAKERMQQKRGVKKELHSSEQLPLLQDCSPEQSANQTRNSGSVNLPRPDPTRPVPIDRQTDDNLGGVGGERSVVVLPEEEEVFQGKPHWREAFLREMASPDIRNPNRYRKTLIANWQKGDGTPMPPQPPPRIRPSVVGKSLSFDPLDVLDEVIS